MATTMNNNNNVRLLEGAEGHNGDGHLYEQSPAYKALLEIGLIARQYRIKDAEQIECRAANSDNCTMCCCDLLCVTNCVRIHVEVKRGTIRVIEDGRGGYEFLGPGLHRIVDPFVALINKEHDLGLKNFCISYGDRSICTVEQGFIGLAFDNGQPVLLPPGLHQWQSPTLRFEQSIDLNNSVITLGPFTLLTVDEGYSAITQDNGAQKILSGGSAHMLTHRNWKFEKFMTEKIQTDNLAQILAASADNVLMTVDATVNWRIIDVQTAALMSAETMSASGQAGAADTGIPKLRKDVLLQATASLSAFIGTVNYSDTFAVASVEHTRGNREATPLFDLDRLTTGVEHANAVTANYGVKILSINVISAKPEDRVLVKELAAGAVAAAQALQAETAARGNAKASEISAQGSANAAIIRAKGDAEAEQLRAEGARKAADVLQTSDVAVALAKIDKTGLALSTAKSTFFFGSDPQAMGSVLANNGLVKQ